MNLVSTATTWLMLTSVSCALDALEKERNQLLEQLRLFDMQRARAKARGRRTLSNAEREKLDAIRRGE